MQKTADISIAIWKQMLNSLDLNTELNSIGFGRARTEQLLNILGLVMHSNILSKSTFELLKTDILSSN